MALINGYYVFVEGEEITRGVDVTSHPVEKGLEVTDNVRKKPLTISLKGKIVQSGSVSAATIENALEELHRNGKYVKYQGRHNISDALITDFTTKASNDVWGGYSFDAEIQEVRIAKSAYKPSSSGQTTTTTRQTTQNNNNQRYHTVKSGDCPWAIAEKYYNDGTKWESMMKANTDIVARNKKWGVLWYSIYVGDKLLIP